MTDISYESMHIAMEASGYKLKQTSPQGSRLYVADDYKNRFRAEIERAVKS